MIQRSIAEKIVVEGINVAIHTFGCGGEHDADLLMQLSTLGDGRYYYVEKDDQVYRICV